MRNLPKAVQDMLDNMDAMMKAHSQRFMDRAGDRRKSERRSSTALTDTERRQGERRAGTDDRRTMRFSASEPPFNPYDIQIP